jgi:hypothetical protein
LQTDRQAATSLRKPGGRAGPTVLAAVGDMVDYVSLHLYGATTQLTDGPGEYDAIVAQPLYFEQPRSRSTAGSTRYHRGSR